MNIVSIYKTLARKPTQTSSTIMLSFLLTANSKMLHFSPNSFFLKKRKLEMKHQQTLVGTGFSNVIGNTPNGTPV